MKANPGVKLPADDIVVVHRSDGSGTTYIWTDYLSKVSTEWETKVGRGTSVNWPVGLGGKGNEGVSGPGEADAQLHRLRRIDLRRPEQDDVRQGEERGGRLRPSQLGQRDRGRRRAAKEMPEDFRVSITNAPGKDAYPISSFTWLLIPEKIADPAKKKAIKDFSHGCWRTARR